MFKDEIRAVFPYIFMLFTKVCGKLPIIFDRDKVSCIVLYGNVSKPTSLYKLANRCGRAEKTSRFFRPLADGCFEGRFSLFSLDPPKSLHLPLSLSGRWRLSREKRKYMVPL